MLLKRNIKRIVAFCVMFSMLITLFFLTPVTYASSAPANPNATQEARDLLNYLYSIKGSNIISGMFNYINDSAAFTREVNRVTGKYPGLWGCDLSFYSGGDLAAQRQAMINEAINQANNGSVISLCWHMQRPDLPADSGWDGVKAWADDTTIREFVTPGTTRYNQLIAALDEGAVYLKQLKDAGIPVLWRPFHEMNYGFFWWGGRAYEAKELYKIMYDRYVNYHHLDNLIWVWNVNRRYSEDGIFADFYPGSQYVDVLSADIYLDYGEYDQSCYTELTAVDPGKPCAIGENGVYPDMDYLQSTGQDYVYFMTWGNWLYYNEVTGAETNSMQDIIDCHNHPYVLTQDEINIQPSPVNEWTRLDDGDGSVSYDSGWGTYYGNPGYQQTEHYSEVTGSTATFTFTGTQARYYGFKRNDLGIAEIYIDGILKATVDCYSSYGEYEYLLYESEVLPSGTHTLAVRVSGSKNPSSSGTEIICDAFEYINDTQSASLITVNDNTTGTGNNQFEYSGTWYTSTGAGKYNEDDHYSGTTNSYYQVRFYGTQVKIYASLASHHGIFGVSIDGGSETNVDCYSATRQDQVLLYTSPVLPAGQHTLRVRVTGTKNSNSAGYIINADRVDIINESTLLNLVQNSEFDSGTDGWYWMQSGSANGSMGVVTGAGLSGTNALKVTLTNGGADPWNAQVNQDFPIESGKTYTISFKAKADAPRNMSIIIQQSTSPYTGYWYQDVSLTGSAQTYGDYTFTCNTTDPGAVLRFNLGGNATSVYIDDVVITAE